MSMMKTLARVAGGVILAKGLSTAMQQRNNTGSGNAGYGSGGRRSGGGLLGNLGAGASGGGLGGLLGQVLGGGHSGGQQGRGGSASSGGLGGMMDRLSGGNRGGTSGGGLGGMLGGLLGGAAGGAAAAGVSDRLIRKDTQAHNDSSFGALFNDAIIRKGEPEIAPTPEQNAVAALMLRAMIQSAKADGRIDDAERERLTADLGELDDDEREFIRVQMEAPVDVQALARDVPKGMEAQTYLMSLTAIDLDSAEEARYLHSLAEAMSLDRDTVNAIHDELGVVTLYK